MDVLAISLALGMHVFPWACHQYQPHIDVVRAQLPPGVIAEADIGGWPRCQVRLGDPWYRLKPSAQCTVLGLHEVGHLAGLSHTTNWRSVMRPDPLALGPDRRCVRALSRARAPPAH